MAKNLSFPALQVKNNDYYRYICCLFAPEMVRENLFAFYAFNHEIAKLRDFVAEPMAGLVRLSWWREAIGEIYDNQQTRKVELLESLALLINSTNLPRHILEQIIDAREADLGFTKIVNQADMDKYIQGTSIALLEASMIIAGENVEQGRKVAEYIGTAYALAGIMRRAKWDAPKKCVMLSSDLLQKYGISEDDMVVGKNIEKTKNLVRYLCDEIAENLYKAMSLKNKMSKNAMPVYLHATLAGIFLKRIRKNNYDIFNSNLENGRLQILCKMFFDAKSF